MSLLLAAALIQAQASAVPGAIEIRPGLFVVQGEPTAATFAALRTAGVTHVFNLRTDVEGDFTFESEASKAAGATYDHCPVDHAFTPAALDAFRSKLRSLPMGSRALVHCASGNRAAAALMAAWVLDGGMPLPEALNLARKAGLVHPALERAALDYIRAQQAARPVK